MRMFRIYDTNNKVFAENLFVDEYEQIYQKKDSLIRGGSMVLLSNVDFILQKSTGITDREGIQIFEGDVCKCHSENEEEEFVGVVTYVEQECRFVLLDYENALWYELSEKVADTFLEVIGNVFSLDVNEFGNKVVETDVENIGDLVNDLKNKLEEARATVDEDTEQGEKDNGR